MQILHLDSSIQADGSASRVLSAAIVAELVATQPGATVTARDLARDPIPHLDGAIAAAFRQPDAPAADAATRAEHARSEALVREFLASDVIVLGVPMYNFSVPTQLKAWFDRIAQPGRTFRYTETGPVGLAGGKTVIVAATRGGMYSAGPAAAMDFHETYLRAFFRFLGIGQVSIVRAELLTKGPVLRAQSIGEALASVPAAVAHATEDK
jgi:FMN-dependent NADH-azoreductase